MTESDKTWAGLFLASCAFWAITAGIQLDPFADTKTASTHQSSALFSYLTGDK